MVRLGFFWLWQMEALSSYQCTGFSLRWLLSYGSRALEKRGLRSCGTRAWPYLWPRGIFPGQGLHLGAVLAVGLLHWTTRKPLFFLSCSLIQAASKSYWLHLQTEL